MLLMTGGGEAHAPHDGRRGAILPTDHVGELVPCPGMGLPPPPGYTSTLILALSTPPGYTAVHPAPR